MLPLSSDEASKFSFRVYKTNAVYLKLDNGLVIESTAIASVRLASYCIHFNFKMASCVQGAAILALDKYDKGSLGMDWNTI